MQSDLSYKDAGVDIDAANATKKQIKNLLDSKNSRILNKVGAFASLYDIKFPEYDHPILVLKMEEPGSKQKLAFQYNRLGSLSYDLVNHLINDVIVMGARPLAVLDVVVCGKLNQGKIAELISGMARACREQGCDLVGGETSEQPGVLASNTHVLAASAIGIVEKSKIIDGSAIRSSDVIIALSSNGLHTNGYSLVRKLIENRPRLMQEDVGEEKFIDAIMKPHTAYYHQVASLFSNPAVHGLAHITGGGIKENLNRILPKHLSAQIDLARIKILPIFKEIRQEGNITDTDMLRMFNMGVGMAVVVNKKKESDIRAIIEMHGGESYVIGEIIKGNQQVNCLGKLMW